jgi:predicted phosphate transport protein (TIGR00153 family)
MEVLEWLGERSERKMLSSLQETSKYMFKSSQAVERMLNGEDCLEELHAYERETDSIRKRMAANLVKSDLERMDKQTIASLAKHTNRVVDHLYAVAKLIGMLHPSGAILSKAKLIQAKNDECIATLSKCMEALAKGNRPEALRLADAVERFEEETDEMYASARRMMLKLKTMDVPAFLMTYELFSELENVSDACEKACDDIRLLLVR